MSNFFIHTRAALVQPSRLYYGFFLQLNFWLVPKREEEDNHRKLYITQDR